MLDKERLHRNSEWQQCDPTYCFDKISDKELRAQEQIKERLRKFKCKKERKLSKWRTSMEGAQMVGLMVLKRTLRCRAVSHTRREEGRVEYQRKKSTKRVRPLRQPGTRDRNNGISRVGMMLHPRPGQDKTAGDGDAQTGSSNGQL